LKVFGIVARGNRMRFVDIFGDGWRPRPGREKFEDWRRSWAGLFQSLDESLLVRKDGFGGLVETGGFLREYAHVMVHRNLSKDLRSVVDRGVLTPA
jgi:hypothetical protein